MTTPTLDTDTGRPTVYSRWRCPTCATEYAIEIVDAFGSWRYDVVKEGAHLRSTRLPASGIVSADVPFCVYDAVDLVVDALVAEASNGRTLNVGVRRGEN